MKAVAIHGRVREAEARPTPGNAAGAIAALAVGLLGAATLALRPVGWAGVGATAAVGLVALAALRTGVGTRAPRAGAASGPSPTPAAALAVGLLAVLTARAVGGAAVPGPVAAVGVGASLVAAVAEEALFRGVLHGALERLGARTALAIGLPAALFALAHVPGYGARALAVNLAAGLLLGWQRHASGSWGVPATTHGVANIVQIL